MKPATGPMFYAAMFLIVIATMLLHELTHWLVGTALGYDMYFTLTTSGIVDGAWNSQRDFAIVSIAGPLFTASIGVLGAWLAITKRMALGYELVFGAFMQRFVAMILSGVFIPNDEARVSLFLGWAWWVLPLVFVVFLLALTIWASRAMRFGVLVNFLCYLTASAAFTVMVFADGQLAGFEGPGLLDPLLPEAARYGN